MIKLLRVLCVLLMLGGIASVIYRNRSLPASPVTDIDSETVATPDEDDVTLKEFTIDISGMQHKLSELPEDEWSEQLADWAVYGTLGELGLSPESLRAATFDRVPFRDPSLVETVNFDYGPGRRVALSESKVGLFYSEFDAPRRNAVLARLADQVRMEQGTIPSTFAIFRYRTALRDGMINVVAEEEIDGQELFTEEYGYVETTIRSSQDLKAWVSKTDDVTHVQKTGGAVVIGGRRNETARTESITLEDVAALYQAHLELNRASEDVKQIIVRASKPAADAYDDLVNEFNKNVDRFNSGQYWSIDASALQRAVSKVELMIGERSSLDSDDSLLPGHSLPPDFQFDDFPGLGKTLNEEMMEAVRQRRKQNPLNGFDYDHDFGRRTSNLEEIRLVDQHKQTLEGIGARIELLQPKVSTFVENVQKAKYEELIRDGRIPPGEPGFSLDPQWNTRGLLNDLQLLVDNVPALVNEANQIVEASEGIELDESATPVAYLEARNIQTLFGPDDEFEKNSEPEQGHSDVETEPEDRTNEPGAETAPDEESDRGSLLSGLWLHADPESWSVPNNVEREIRSFVRNGGSGGAAADDDRTILGFFNLKDRLQRADDDDSAIAYQMLTFIEARNRFQSARYDGPLKGTRVGMVLFYTDVLAKLWAGVDYYRSAPTEEVQGFRSGPRIAWTIEPEYWEEVRTNPATRLWFGPKKQGYALSENGSTLNFSHIATRVYSLSSHPLLPGQEVPTTELSRRVMDWWDRQFARVADYEQQYHVQNQIMKWSVITGWLFESGDVSDLRNVSVYDDHRFDKWLFETDGLRFQRDIRMLPENEWLGGTETMEILQSYTFAGYGWLTGVISGGVSLGGKQSIESGTRLSNSISSKLRRPGFDYVNSSARNDGFTKLRSLTGNEYRLPKGDLNRVVIEISPSELARFRSGPSELIPGQVTSRIESNGVRTEIAVGSSAGDFGRLSIGRSGAKKVVRLDWNRGSLEVDRKLADLMARELSHGPSNPAAHLASQSGLQPADGVYVLSREGSVEALLGARSHYVRGPPRRIVAGPASNDMRQSHLAVARVEQRPNVFETPSLIRARVATVGESTVTKRLELFEWQHLRPLTEGSEVPGHVGRVFSTNGPASEAVPVVLRTGDSRVPEISGFVSDGTLSLKRPPKAPPELFNDLVTRQGITSRSLSESIGKAETGQPLTWNRKSGSVTAPRNEIAELVVDGDISGAAQRLRSAAKEGRFEESMSSFKDGLRNSELNRLVAGRRNPAARRFVESLNRTTESANDMLLTGLERLHDGNLAEGMNSVAQAVKRGDLSPDFLSAAGKVATESGQPHLESYLRLHGGEFREAAPDLTSRVELTSSGTKVQTVLKEPPTRNRRLLNASERLEALEQGGAFYVKQGSLLSRVDWDVSPGRTLRQLVDKPGVEWHQVDADSLGRFRPSRVQFGSETQTETFDMPTGSEIRSAARRLSPTSAIRGMPRVYYLISCPGSDEKPCVLPEDISRRSAI